ncbi:MAG: hypothetical protein IJ685_06955 [Selenomonadaceae bacterium]|nr:hypothetical protein [Selenomonadaceae bacterium]
MKIDTVEERRKIMNDLIKKSFKLDEMLLHDEANVDDWVSNIEIMKNLISLEKMMFAEEIFLNTLDEMNEVHSRNRADKEIYMNIVDGSLNYYISAILLHLLEYTYDTLDDWQFKTDAGKKFHKSVYKKLGALIDKYEDLYII